jgi:hypothetical protein
MSQVKAEWLVRSGNNVLMEKMQCPRDSQELQPDDEVISLGLIQAITRS